MPENPITDYRLLYTTILQNPHYSVNRVSCKKGFKFEFSKKSALVLTNSLCKNKLFLMLHSIDGLSNNYGFRTIKPPLLRLIVKMTYF